MTEFTTSPIRARVWHEGRMYTPEEAAQARFVVLPTGEVGRLARESAADAPRIDLFDPARTSAMLSTFVRDAAHREVFVGDVIEEIQHQRRYVVQHGDARVSELPRVGFFGAPLGTLERRLLRISDNLSYFRVIGTIFDDAFDFVKRSTP